MGWSNKADETTISDPTENERTKKEIQTICQVAGGKNSLQDLRNLVETGHWSAEELSSPQKNGKSVLHIAAWHGSLENIRYLLDVGCDVNTVATGQYTYGKTPLFFSATKCRDDAVQLLLQYGANPCIVNNKGQSVLSIASSHLKYETIQAVQEAEKRHGNQWVNYRASHSDGLTYGDLEPRFLERPLTSGDNVTEWAINPTTVAIRRGNFARNNPSNAKNKTEKARRRQKQKAVPPELTAVEWQECERIWHQASQTILLLCWNYQSSIHLKDQEPVSENRQFTITQQEKELGQLLMKIVNFWERQRCSWLPKVSTRLGNVLTESGMSLNDERLIVMFRKVVDGIKLHANNNHSVGKNIAREQALVKKIISQALQITDLDGQGSSSPKPKYCQTDLLSRRDGPSNSRAMWEKAWNCVRSLFDDPKVILQNPHRDMTHLSLPLAPRWVSSVGEILLLREELEVHLRRVLSEDKDETQDIEYSAVVALDTEWYTSSGGKTTQMATLQLAWLTDADAEPLKTFVIDLLPGQTPSADDRFTTEYREEISNLMYWLFGDKRLHLLWFAMGHDIPKLNSFVNYNNNVDVDTALKKERCLDLQTLLVEHMKECAEVNEKRNYKSSHLPGLKTCAEFYLSTPSLQVAGNVGHKWILSKNEQCSPWGKRPLSESQLEYAGLDAAVLLVILAQLDYIPAFARV